MGERDADASVSQPTGVPAGRGPLASVLGVLDLQAGQAVHAIAGRRDLYQPVRSSLCADGDFLQLAASYLRLGVGGLYVADLDALCGKPCQMAPLRQLTTLGCPLWIDVGYRDAAHSMKAVRQLDQPHVRWILATESLSDPDEIAHWLTAFGPDRLTVSIDMHQGQVRSPTPGRLPADPVEAVDRFVQRGVRSFTLLEITAVGLGGGPGTAPLCHMLRRRFPEIGLISGGGVRSEEDLRSLLGAGCDRALVASALHSGVLRGEDPSARND